MKAIESKPTLRELEDLAEQIGDFIQYWGFKRVHGRIWTHLLLSNRPLDASDLISRLGISKALASMSLKELLYYQVVLPVGKSRAGTTLYSTNPDLSGVIQNVLRHRERRMMARMLTAYELLTNLPGEELSRHGIDKDRLSHLGKLVTHASRSLEAFLTGFRLDLSILRHIPLFAGASGLAEKTFFGPLKRGGQTGSQS